MRPISSSAFVAGNFLFVYKNCTQLQNASQLPEKKSIEEDQEETLEDSENKEQQTPDNSNNQTESQNSSIVPASSLQNDLNDALFSHCIHPNSGAAFSLLFSVIVHQPDDFVCPICLFKPVAPRVTHCGHIFCADCIAQHISMTDEPFCPVCYEKLLNQDSVQLIRTDLRFYPKIGTIINLNDGDNKIGDQKMELHFLFQKIKRSHKNCVCFKANDQSLYLPKASESSAPYCHFMLSDTKYCKSLIEKEKKDLLDQIEIFKEYKDELKISFINEVYEAVCKEDIPDDDGPRFFLQETKANDFFTFYQDSGGRLIFLDPMCIKMLSMQFGSINEAPDQLELDALKLTTMHADQRFRDRHHSLGHLPAGADVTFVLADLKSIVSSDVYSLFAAKIDERLKVDDDIDDNVPENEPLTEADFPAVFTLKQPNSAQPPPAKKGWANLKIDQQAPQNKNKMSLENDFPSFGAVFPKKKAAWGTPGAKTQTNSALSSAPSKK